MIAREIAKIILSLKDKLPVSVITGPRQSGKTTLVKALFPEYDYVNMEFPDTRAQAIDDARLFLTAHKRGLVIDEVQQLKNIFLIPTEKQEWSKGQVIGWKDTHYVFDI